MFRSLFVFTLLISVVVGSGCATRPTASIGQPPRSSDATASVAAKTQASTVDSKVTRPTVAPSPQIVVPATPATIVGSEETSALLDNFTAYIVAVDEREIPAGRRGWAEPVALAAGPHRLTVGFVRGVFNATARLELTAQAGAAYELRHQSDAQIYGDHSYCEFWVANKNTGEKITGVVRVEIKRLKP